MTPTSSSAYPLGFICATDATRLISVPPTFKPTDFPIPLFCHPKTVRTSIVQHQSALILLGHALHTERPFLSRAHIVDVLFNLLNADESLFCDELRFVCGRYAIIYSSKGGPFKILNDATAMRSIFYTCDRDAVIVGSHANLVNGQRVNPATLRPIPMRWGYPGVRTPLDGVCLLTSNTQLNLESGQIERFYPVSPTPQMSIDDAAFYIADRVEGLITTMAERCRPLLSITAGIDSRTTLALSLKSSSSIKYFTYQNNAVTTSIDAQFCRDVARSFKLDHKVLDVSAEPPLCQKWKDVFARNTYYSHGQRLARAYLNHFGDGHHLHIRSNLLEIGRCFYNGKRVPVPDTAQRAAQLYMTLSPATGIRHFELTQRLFVEYFARTDQQSAIQFIEAADLFYWEHRMGAWHGLLLLESDISFDTFIPFNARNIFEAMLSVPFESRKRGDVFKRIIQMKSPELAELPINPPSWSVAGT
jgi:hypothetical protein